MMNTFTEFLQDSPILFILGTGFIGLLVGSFLNVVIARLPLMVLSEEQGNANRTFNLFYPRSQCPRCHHLIAWFHNIPVFSFLFLKGKCHNCHQKISARYPLVELLSMTLSMLIATTFGCDITTIAALLLTWALIALTFIDIDHTILPDDITLPCLWLGLWFNIHGTFATPTDAILGAIVGYLSLYLFYWIFKLITKKEGMGYGDFKLLAMLGAWLGWQALPLIILFSSLIGSVVGIYLISYQGKNKNTAIPFGPYLVTAGFMALLWGNQLYHWYFNKIGIHL